jgi:hypothetical protein
MMMQRSAARSMALAMFLILSGRSMAAEPAKANVWIQQSLAAAQAEARKTGKPIFAVIRCER